MLEGQPADRPNGGGAAAAALRTSHRFPTVPNVPQMMMPFFISARFAQLATYKISAAAALNRRRAEATAHATDMSVAS